MPDSTYKIIELVGSSSESWEDAAKTAIETACRTLRDLRITQVEKLDMQIEDGKVVAYRAKVKLSFRVERPEESYYHKDPTSWIAEMEHTAFDG